MAKEKDVNGRSKMDKKELIKNIQKNRDDRKRNKNLRDKTKEELYDMAQKDGISGRSK